MGEAPSGQRHIDHDRLFKELIQTFFEEFMLLFFPQAFEAIDFGHIKFLSEQVFTDVTAGEKRLVDLLVETRLKGEDGLIIVHIESQSYVQPDFNERMFIYFSRLYEKYRRPVLPIAVFGYDSVRDEPDTFRISFPFRDVMCFQFYTLVLRKQNWRHYIRQDNPVAAALLTKMGFSYQERVQVRKEFLRLLVRFELDPARLQLIVGFFDTYLKLNEEEERQLQEEIKQLPVDEGMKIMSLMTSWEEKGIQKGREEGKQEVAVNMLQMGMDVKIIAKVTGLPIETIEALKKECK